MEKLYILDGHAEVYRAYFAKMPDLTSKSGEPTKATYVFTKALMKLLREHKPTHIVMAVESRKEHCIRRKLYPKYKSSRTGPVSELKVQLDRIKQIVRAMGIKVVHSKGYEADDVIATYVRKYQDKVDEVVIVGRDKDLMQLVTDKVRMYDAIERQFIEYEDVLVKWEVKPSAIFEVQSLCGDTTDDIPGIRNIGPATAIKLIKKYGTARKVCKAVKKDPTILPAKARPFFKRKMIRITRELVRLHDCWDLLHLSDLALPNPNFDAAKPIFKELGFKRWS